MRNSSCIVLFYYLFFLNFVRTNSQSSKQLPVQIHEQSPIVIAPSEIVLAPSASVCDELTSFFFYQPRYVHECSLKNWKRWKLKVKLALLDPLIKDAFANVIFPRPIDTNEHAYIATSVLSASFWSSRTFTNGHISHADNSWNHRHDYTQNSNKPTAPQSEQFLKPGNQIEAPATEFNKYVLLPVSKDLPNAMILARQNHFIRNLQ